MAGPKSNGFPKASAVHLGFEAKLWLTADIRRALIEADLVDFMVALPGRSWGNLE